MIKPNVLLVIPRYASTKVCGYIMPLGILYVSAALKASGVANVFTINLNHQEEDDITVLTKIIKQNNITIVGCGGISGQFIEIYPLFKLVKTISPEIITIAGGGMITADAEIAMSAFDGYADYGIVGEGEITLPELVVAIANNRPKQAVKGIIYKDAHRWIVTPQREDIDDLDSVPLPDYKGFDYDKYLSTNGEVENGIKYSPVAIIGGRSCKYKCTFCFHPTGSKYRQRSLDSIFKEIDYLIANYDVNYIALREELFASDKERVSKFCKRIEKYPLVWSIQLRVDSVDEEMVCLLKQSNCRYLFLGIESADNTILKSMRKGITIEQVESALELTIKHNVDTRSTIIFGDEIESIETSQQTLNWWLAHKPYSSIAIDMIIAFPGSTLYSRAIKNGRISDPIMFLKAGCPIINLSNVMSDEQYNDLVNRVGKHNHISYSIHKFK